MSTTTTAIEASAGASPGGIEKSGQLNIEVFSVEQRGDAADGAEFRAALERHMNAPSAGSPVHPGPANSASLGDKIMTRATDMATELKNDHQYVSKMLEQASRSADSMQLMKAMMALHDYQIRVQTVSKVTFKAVSALEQLTKLQ